MAIVDPGVLLDQHLVARQRQNRLPVSVLERPDLLGVGVDERTAGRSPV